MKFSLRSLLIFMTVLAAILVYLGYVFNFYQNASAQEDREFDDFARAVAAAQATPSKTENDKYDLAIDSFILGTPESETADAVVLIESGGVDAFSALVSRLDDSTDACNRFMYTIGYTGDGPHEPYHPSIGFACFDLIRGQIEGYWPRALRQYYVLDRSNVRDWLDKRKSKTMHELQIECATLSLESARLRHSENPSDWTENCVNFFSENLSRFQDISAKAE